MTTSFREVVKLKDLSDTITTLIYKKSKQNLTEFSSIRSDHPNNNLKISILDKSSTYSPKKIMNIDNFFAVPLITK